MPHKHVRIRLEENSPYIGETCPVKRSELSLGEEISLCRESDTPFSIDGWKEVILADSHRRCPYCNEADVAFDLPLVKSLDNFPPEPITRPVKDTASGSITVGPEKPSGGYSYEEPRRRDVRISIWAFVTFGGGILVVIGLLVGLLFSGGMGAGGVETETPSVEIGAVSISEGTSSYSEETPEPTPSHTSSPIISKSPTPTRTSKPTSTNTPTLLPTPTNSPQPTPTPLPATPTPLPPTPTPASIVSCSNEPNGEFRNLWAKYKERLGCPHQTEPIGGFWAEQPFQNGHMFWSRDAQLYLITIGQGNETWQLFPENDSVWKEGMPQLSCNVEVPPGLIQPVRGFGGLWCQYDNIHNQIGWGVADERGFEDGIDLIQGFVGGIIFRDSDGLTNNQAYILFNDNETFVKESY